MSDQPYELFFLQPDDVLQRRYETLRAVIVEHLPMKEVAKRFQISYGTVRNWVSEFRRQWDQGGLPPFSLGQHGDVLQKMRMKKTNQKSKSRTYGSCRWSLDVA